MKATLPDGTILEGSPAEVAEALRAMKAADAVGKMLEALPRPMLPPPPFLPALPWFDPTVTGTIQAGCRCTKPDALNPVIFWGGECPLHSLRGFAFNPNACAAPTFSTVLQPSVAAAQITHTEWRAVALAGNAAAAQPPGFFASSVH